LFDLFVKPEKYTPQLEEIEQKIANT